MRTEVLTLPGQDLRVEKSSHSLLPIAPPVAICKPSPPHGAASSACRCGFKGQHTRDAPTLRRIARLRIKLLNFRCQRRHVPTERYSSKIRPLRNLILEHEIHGLWAEDLRASFQRLAVIEEHAQQLCIRESVNVHRINLVLKRCGDSCTNPCSPVRCRTCRHCRRGTSHPPTQS